MEQITIETISIDEKKLNLEDMKKYIEHIVKGYNKKYVPIYDVKSIENIYNLFRFNKTFDGDLNGIECFYFGWYYCDIMKDYNLMKMYYLLAIDKGETAAMNNLGCYYADVENNCGLMKKYYLMAIEKGEPMAMNNLGHYYQNVEKKYDLTKKYYFMAIDKGNVNAMTNLGYYYQNVEKNYELMKKYYLMAIDKGYIAAMNHLGNYYYHIDKNYDLMKKYYIMGIEKSENELMHYYMEFRNDLSYLNLYEYDKKNEDSVKNKKVLKLMRQFNENIILPKEYYTIFCSIKLSGDEDISQTIINKQNILKNTNIWPTKYSEEYLTQFNEMLSLSINYEKSSLLLPKDMILQIAGYLFV